MKILVSFTLVVPKLYDFHFSADTKEDILKIVVNQRVFNFQFSMLIEIIPTQRHYSKYLLLCST